MIAKKNPRQDLERRRVTIFTIGLLAAGSFTLAAFTYVSPVESTENEIALKNSTVEYYIQEKQPETPEVVKPEVETPEQTQQESTTTLIAEVTEDINKKESTDKEVKSDTPIEDLNRKFGEFDIFIKAKEVDAGVVEFPDKDAEYVNGYEEMVRFIQTNLNYPEDAIRRNKYGRVTVEFVVNKDGSVSDVKVAKGEDESLNREAARIVRSFPNWIPAEYRGRIVASRVRVPIVFTLEY